MKHSAKSITDEDLLISDNVRQLRLTLGISQMALARQIGITYQQLQKYEAATNRISASTLLRIAKILGVPVAKLYGDDEIYYRNDTMLAIEAQRCYALLPENKKVLMLEVLKAMGGKI